MAQLIKSLANGDGNLQGLFSPWGQGVDQEFPTLQSSSISLATNLYPEGLSKNHLISINSDVKVLIINNKRLLTLFVLIT